MAYTPDPLRQMLFEFGNGICDNYGLEKNARYKYTNGTQTRTIDPEMLRKAINKMMDRDAKDTPPTNQLRLDYETVIRGSTPLPKPICSSCYARIDKEDMEAHMPLCSYTAMTTLTSQQRKDLMSIHALMGEKKAHIQGKEWIQNGK